jgi:hypothetical protein
VTARDRRPPDCGAYAGRNECKSEPAERTSDTRQKKHTKPFRSFSFLSERNPLDVAVDFHHGKQASNKTSGE